MNLSNPEVKSQWDKYALRSQKAIEHFKNEMLSVRAGRANPSMLNKITVDYYGTPTAIPQMANITVPEARMLVISPWDATAIKEINKAILASDLGLNPTDDGKVIRLSFPQLTEDRRKELVKGIKKTGEDSKVALRNERRDLIDALKKLKKDNHLTEDDLVSSEKEVQKKLDGNIAEVDRLLKDKEKEIMEV